MSSIHEDQLRRIQPKLEVAKQRDHALAAFGANSHKYKLNAAIEISALERFETEIGVKLPSCYRDFILLIGNGGAGPRYGIWPIGEPPPINNPMCLHSNVSFTPKLYKGITESEWHKLSEPLILATDDESYDRAVAEIYSGMLVIESGGCGDLTAICLTEPGRGSIWYLCGEESWPWCAGTNFLDWYENWLDELAACEDGS